MEKAKTVVLGNRVYRPLLDDTITNEDKKVAEAELNETPGTREVALELFKQLLDAQSDFTARTDDSFLIKFLRVRKFDVEKAYILLMEHYRFRAQYPEIFPSPSGIEKALRANIVNYLPHRDHKGRAIYIVKMDKWNIDEISYSDFVAAGYIISEYVLDNPVTQINGYVAIWDFKGFTLRHFIPFCLPKHVFLLSNLMQDRFPARFKIAYVLNSSSLCQTAWKLFKNILKDKFKKRVRLMSSMKELHQYFDLSILPKEFGGVLPPLENTELAERILDNEQYYNYNKKFGFDKNDF